MKYLHFLVFAAATVFFSFFHKKFKGIIVSNTKIWMRNFRRIELNSASYCVFPMFKEFLNTNIFIVKQLHFETNKSLIAICVIKNDLEKLKKFLEHHRNLGIKQFAFLDDKSTDGTKEYLLKQQDVELFESNDSFFTVRKEAWINRILAYYGFDRWYAVLDSDELLVYDNCENNNIHKFIDIMEKESITAISGKMIDMYFCDNIEYFDKTGYTDDYSRFMPNQSGGMRLRVFGMQMVLSKTPLFFLDEKTIFQIHNIFPFGKNFQKINALALLHYKFLEGDLEKYKERVNNKSMFKGSKEYKVYVEKMSNEKLTFYNEQVSEKYVNSKNLVNAKLLEKLEW